MNFTLLFNLIDSNLASRLQSLSHRCNAASLSPFYKYFHSNYLDELSSLMSRRHEYKRTHRFTVELARWNHRFYSSSEVFFPAILLCGTSYFLFPCNLQKFKYNCNRHIVFLNSVLLSFVLHVSNSLSIAVTPCFLVALSPFLGLKWLKEKIPDTQNTGSMIFLQHFCASCKNHCLLLKYKYKSCLT